MQQGLANWQDRWSEMSRGMGKNGEQLNSDEHHLRIFWRRWDELMGRGMTIATRAVVTRTEVEDFLYHGPRYSTNGGSTTGRHCSPTTPPVVPNDQLESDHRSTLFLVADDRERIRQRDTHQRSQLPRRIS